MPETIVLPTRYLDTDADGEPTLWDARDGDPKGILRRCDLGRIVPAAYRDEVWASVVAGVPTVPLTGCACQGTGAIRVAPATTGGPDGPTPAEYEPCHDCPAAVEQGYLPAAAVSDTRAEARAA